MMKGKHNSQTKGKERKTAERKKRREKQREVRERANERKGATADSIPGRISVEGKPVVIEHSFDTYQNSSHQKISVFLSL